MKTIRTGAYPTILAIAIALTLAFAVNANAQMGHGMMGQEMMMGDTDNPGSMKRDCPMGGPGMKMGMGHGMMGYHSLVGVEMEVKELKNGVTVTLTTDDKTKARKVQIMAEIMKLVKEMKELKMEK